MFTLLTVVAGVCIVAGCAGAGAVLAANLRRRPPELARLQAALGQLESEIGYLATPLPEALARAAAAAAGPARLLLQQAASQLADGDGRTAGEAWTSAVAAADARSAWTEGDLRALADLAPILGASGRDEQVRHIARCRERLRAAEAEARGQCERAARCWMYLGALGGLGLVVALL